MTDAESLPLKTGCCLDCSHRYGHGKLQPSVPSKYQLLFQTAWDTGISHRRDYESAASRNRHMLAEKFKLGI